MDWALTAAGFGVGVIVGLTGMGGGALMTPILVIFFGIPPLAAVSSDLVASAVMKPVGSLVYIRRRRVDWRLVGWLCAGSTPAAFCGVLVARSLGGARLQDLIQIALGIALLLAVAGLVIRSIMRMRAGAVDTPADELPRVRVRPLATAVLGAAGGLIVGMTSVGSGSLIIVVLLALYPMLSAADLVGTDLVQSIPLVASAALGHVIFGDFTAGITVALLIGSIPGVFVGAQISTLARGSFVRRALTVVLFASALKLLHATNAELIAGVIAVIIAGPLLGVAVRRHYRRRAPLAASPPAPAAPATLAARPAGRGASRGQQSREAL